MVQEEVANTRERHATELARKDSAFEQLADNYRTASNKLVQVEAGSSGEIHRLQSEVLSLREEVKTREIDLERSAQRLSDETARVSKLRNELTKANAEHMRVRQQAAAAPQFPPTHQPFYEKGSLFALPLAILFRC